MALSVCACGGSTNTSDNTNDVAKKESTTDITDLLGFWHDRDGRQYIVIENDKGSLYRLNKSLSSTTIPSIDGNTISIQYVGKYEIDNSDEKKLTCIESDYVPKGTVFVFEKESIVPIEDIISNKWIDTESGDLLSFKDGKATVERKTGASITNAGQNEIVGDILYLRDFDCYLVSKDGDNIVLSGDKGSKFMSESAADDALKKYSVGEKASCDTFEVTLKDYEFTERLGSSNTTKLFERDVVWDAPDDKDMVYILFHFDYTNLSKETINMYWDSNVTIDYNNGYLYKTADATGAYIFEDDINGVYSKYRIVGLGGINYKMDLSPLQSGKYFSAIPVPKRVSEDESADLRIIFEQNGNEIVYKIR